MAKHLLLTLALFIGARGVAFAAVVDHLYKARVTIENQTVTAQAEAVRRALAQVLVKVSGDKEVALKGQIRSRLNQARDLLQAFRFETDNGQLFYHSQFDPAKVNNLLRGAQLPIWGERRPQTLVWLAVKTPADRAILLSETLSVEYQQPITSAARARGIPVIFPVLGLAEREQVGFYDVWGRFAEVLMDVSVPYQAEVVIIARLYQQAMEDDGAVSTNTLLVPADQKEWVLDWQRIHDNQISYHSVRGDAYEPLLQQLMDINADSLARRFAVSTEDGSLSKTELRVRGIKGLEDLVLFERLLKDIAVIANAQLIGVKGDQATYSLRLFGQPLDLEHILSLDSRLEKQRDSFGIPLATPDYQWLAP